jgi:hypothetical protein
MSILIVFILRYHILLIISLMPNILDNIINFENVFLKLNYQFCIQLLNQIALISHLNLIFIDEE